jgi:hypothetical protein
MSFICFVPSPDRLAYYVAQVANFPPGPAIAAMFFPSASLSLVPASPDSSFTPARELSARAAASFDLDFWIRSSRYWLSCSRW